MSGRLLPPRHRPKRWLDDRGAGASCSTCGWRQHFPTREQRDQALADHENDRKEPTS